MHEVTSDIHQLLMQHERFACLLAGAINDYEYIYIQAFSRIGT